MTREEAIEALTSKDVHNSDKMLEALDMAVKALEQEPCEDCVSREAVINITWQDPTYTDPLNVLTEVRDKVKALPPVTPTQRWIPVSERLPELGEAVLTYHEDDEEYQINWVTDDETVEWFYENPIAWMPLPKPYKAESEDKE